VEHWLCLLLNNQPKYIWSPVASRRAAVIVHDVLVCDGAGVLDDSAAVRTRKDSNKKQHEWTESTPQIKNNQNQRHTQIGGGEDRCINLTGNQVSKESYAT
jgi:hypothetical protein